MIGKTGLSTKDVAHLLDMSPDDVLALAHKGLLKATKGKRYWSYRLSDVTRYKTRIQKMGEWYVR